MRRLLCFLEQETVVAVRRLDHVALDRLAQRQESAFDLSRSHGRVEPVRAERDQQHPGRDALERPGQRPTAVLAGEVG